jgi:hypothetical protein
MFSQVESVSSPKIGDANLGILQTLRPHLEYPGFACSGKVISGTGRSIKIQAKKEFGSHKPQSTSL